MQLEFLVKRLILAPELLAVTPVIADLNINIRKFQYTFVNMLQTGVRLMIRYEVFNLGTA